MAPVILQMDVHCHGCAGKIRKVLKNLFGVEEVWVSVDTGLVVVSGTSLDASLLRWKIQRKVKRPVTVVSDGADEQPPPPQYALPPPGYPPFPHYSGMMHLAPPAPYAQPPPPPSAGCPPPRRRSTCSSTCPASCCTRGPSTCPTTRRCGSTTRNGCCAVQ